MKQALSSHDIKMSWQKKPSQLKSANKINFVSTVQVIYSARFFF